MKVNSSTITDWKTTWFCCCCCLSLGINKHLTFRDRLVCWDVLNKIEELCFDCSPQTNTILKVSFISKENGDLKGTQKFDVKQPNNRLEQVKFFSGLANQLGNKINCFPRHHSLSVKCFTRHEENECVMESSWEPLGGRFWHVHWCMQTFVSWLLLRTELSYTVSKKRKRKSGNLRIIQGWKKLWFLKLKRMLV